MDRRIFLACLMFTPMASAQVLQSDPISATTPDREALKAAKAWLDNVDDDHTDLAWETAAPYFQASITKADWADRVKDIRAAFGRIIARSYVSAQATSQLPGTPPGRYLMLHYSTQGYRRAFEDIVVLAFENDSWKVAGFFARSSRAFQIKGVGALPMKWK